MRAITAPEILYTLTSDYRSSGDSIGFVATMGALHEGHLALIERCKLENDHTIVSIFVNPLQFNNPDDLEAYPRDLESDQAKLEELGVDVLFLPPVEDIYPSKPSTQISFGEMDKTLEGEYRSGHFGGVAIIVCKLFHMVQPHRSYFGLKDLQQYTLIKRMVLDLSLPVEVVGVETFREFSGLAKSSRNLRLTENGKRIASKIYEGLKMAKMLVLDGEDLHQARERVVDFFQKQDGLELEYLEFVNPENFSVLQDLEYRDLAVCFAGYIEGVRLIDNLYLPADSFKS